MTLQQARQGAGRIWFYGPVATRSGWDAWRWDWLIPAIVGHDEYARHTICLGYAFTGRIVIVMWDCRDPECIAEALYDLEHPEQSGPWYENPLPEHTNEETTS